jgi:hypothetical protein
MEKLHKDYIKWFTAQFNFHPTDTYLAVNVIDELIAMRNEYQGNIPRPNILDFASKEEVDRVLNKLEIITFEEYKNWKK